MVLKGGVVEKKMRRRSRNMEFFFWERRLRRAKGICGRTPQILF
jgi:hypothetical protein